MSASRHEHCLPPNYPHSDSVLVVECTGQRRKIRLHPDGRVDVEPRHTPEDLALRAMSGHSGRCLCQQRCDQVHAAIRSREKLAKAVKRISRAIWYHRERLERERKLGRGWKPAAPLTRNERLRYVLRKVGAA